jgi:uncharacterized protein with FMN-binding domain
MGVRLSVTPQPLASAPPAFDLSEGEAGQGAGADPAPSPSRSNARGGDEEGADNDGQQDEASASGLRDGRYTGKPVTHPYGTVQVAVTVSGGKITATAVKAPTDGNSGAINSGAVPQLKKQTLEAQTAKVDTISGATYTSQSYSESLQAALDEAKG